MTLDGAADFYRGFYAGWRADVFDRMVQYFGLPRDRKLRTLSRGERAQAALALVVARDPELLILDDPIQGVDPVARREILSALVALIRQEERTILFSSHLLDDVERVCDRVVVLDRGVKRADCPVDTFKQSIRRVRVPKGHDWSELPGLLTVEERPEACVVTVVDEDGSTVERIRGEASGPVEVVPLNLEDAFIAFTAERRKRTLDLRGGRR
jgi:ABC-2 type transport system ATP-binding protein